ncbi:hypothetical protein LQW54_002331 [Pestalotiopsis sp. IQ-011]
MKFLLTLAVVAAVAADVEAIVIPDTASASVSTTKRKGCGRRAHPYSASPAYSTVPTAYSQSMVSSSPEFTSSALIGSYTTSSDIGSTTITTTQSTVSPSSVTTISELSTETASAVSETTVSITSSTESATEASTTVSSTISASASTTESSSSDSTSEVSTTESSTEASTTVSSTTSESTTEVTTTESTTESSSTVSSTVSTTDASPTESTTEASATTTSAIPTTDSTSTDTTPTTSTAAATCVATNTVDGGFEDGEPTSEWTLGPEAYIESNTNNAFTTPYGNWFAVLYGQRAVTAVISQALSNVSPSSTLSFSYRIFTTLSSPLASCAIAVSYADTTLESLTYTFSNVTAARLAGWQTVTLPVDNAPTSGTLAFALACNTYTSTQLDVALDNIYFTKDTACP